MQVPGRRLIYVHKKGFISIEKDKISEEELMDIALDAGAEDINFRRWAAIMK